MTAYRRCPRCPRCGRPLQALAMGAGNALGCDGCSGVFLDDEAFGFVRSSLHAAIVESAEVPMDLVPWDSSPPLACPMCQALLLRTELAGVPVDHCSEHGTWFDARELVAIAFAISQRVEELRGGGSEAVPWSRSAETAEVLAFMSESLRRLRRGREV